MPKAESDELEESSEEKETDVNEQDEQEEVVEEETTEEEIVEEEEVEEKKHETSVPYERFKEKVDQTNTLTQLVGTLQQMIANQQNTGKVEVEKFEKPEDVDEKTWDGIVKYINSQVGSSRKANDEVLGAVLDKLDEVQTNINLPQAKQFSSEIRKLQDEYATSGIYLTRGKAYKLLVADGVIKPSKATKKVVVKRSDSRPVTERRTDGGSKTPTTKSKKPMSQMTDKELDQSMEGKAF